MWYRVSYTSLLLVHALSSVTGMQWFSQQWRSLIKSHCHKVQPILSAVLATCHTNYHLHWELSIDEVMVAFKHWSLMKQYVPKKLTKRGFKVWVHADGHNGYITQFECYTIYGGYYLSSFCFSVYYHSRLLPRTFSTVPQFYHHPFPTRFESILTVL